MEQYLPILSSSNEQFLEQVTTLLEKDLVPVIKKYTQPISLYVSRDWIGRAMEIVGKCSGLKASDSNLL